MRKHPAAVRFAIDPDQTQEPIDFAEIPRPRIGYSGTLTRKVDLFPSWHGSLVVIRGGISCSWCGLGSLDQDPSDAMHLLSRQRNVHLLGFKPHVQLPHYVARMDINLLSPPPTGCQCRPSFGAVVPRVVHIARSREDREVAIDVPACIQSSRID